MIESKKHFRFCGVVEREPLSAKSATHLQNPVDILPIKRYNKNRERKRNQYFGCRGGGTPVTLLEILRWEKGGIYHKARVELTYNSRRMVGSRLTRDQTRYILATNIIRVESGTLNVDDVMETANHFKCIDMIIDNAGHALSDVKSLDDLLDSHYRLERIHLFQDGDSIMITKEQYKNNPCGSASIPYWKAKSMVIPDGMEIVHQDDFTEAKYGQYVDEPYFRLSHNLRGLSAPVLPQGYSLCSASLRDYAAHINSCYAGIGITEEELRSYTARPVYDADLWLAVKDDRTGSIAATGIAELDQEVGEGILEWIQVSEDHRGCGLGSYIVLELLWRMKDKARFATVSGECHNLTNPEALYRRCGFTGSDIWHILRK